MTINFSLFSQFKSLIGFTIERNGRIVRGDNMPMFQRTIEISSSAKLKPKMINGQMPNGEWMAYTAWVIRCSISR